MFACEEMWLIYVYFFWYKMDKFVDTILQTFRSLKNIRYLIVITRLTTFKSSLYNSNV